MIDVNPKSRLTLDEVMRHPWFHSSSSSDGIVEPVLPMRDVVQTYSLTSRDDIDPDVFNGMTSLGCFRDKHKLIDKLLAPDHNEEKIIYFLLLDRKDKKPSLEDEASISLGDQRDPPRKRIDSQAVLPPSFQVQRGRSQSIGSAGLDTITPPRSSTGTPPALYTPTGYYSYYSPQPQQKGGSVRKNSVASSDCQTLPTGATLEGNGGGASPWKRRLSTTLKTIVSSPRFGRRKFDSSHGGSPDASAAPSPQTLAI
jgi:BR serine/threonine kinase